MTAFRNPLEVMAAFAARGFGVDLEVRPRTAAEWPHPWRASLHTTKNELAAYRIQVYAETPTDALTGLYLEAEGAL